MTLARKQLTRIFWFAWICFGVGAWVLLSATKRQREEFYHQLYDTAPWPVEREWLFQELEKAGIVLDVDAAPGGTWESYWENVLKISND